MYKANLRQLAPAVGAFNSVPGAFEGNPEGLKHVFKMEFRTQLRQEGGATKRKSEFSSPDLQLETVFRPDWFMLDLGAADASAINPEAVLEDCELIKRILQKNPEQVNQLVRAFRPDAPLSEIESSITAAERIGLTEEASLKAGGGLLGLLVVAGAAVLLSGCAHCNKHVKSDKTTPSQPRSN